jgi:DNA-binding transcriptional regulator WhiA
MDLSEMNREKINLRWKKIHDLEADYIADNAERNQYLKARVHGYLCGDGSVSFRRERRNEKLHCDIRFYPDHESLIAPFIAAFYRVYGKQPRVKRRKNHYAVLVTSMMAVRDLLKDNSFSSMEWSVPAWIANDKRNSKEWLRAFFDAEAYVGNKRICVQCVNKHGLRQVKEMLEKFGVECKEYSYKRKSKNWNINYHLVISKVESRTNFLNRIGLNHSRKFERLLNAEVA